MCFGDHFCVFFGALSVCFLVFVCFMCPVVFEGCCCCCHSAILRGLFLCFAPDIFSFLFPAPIAISMLTRANLLFNVGWDVVSSDSPFRLFPLPPLSCLPLFLRVSSAPTSLSLPPPSLSPPRLLPLSLPHPPSLSPSPFLPLFSFRWPLLAEYPALFNKKNEHTFQLSEAKLSLEQLTADLQREKEAATQASEVGARELQESSDALVAREMEVRVGQD